LFRFKFDSEELSRLNIDLTNIGDAIFEPVTNISIEICAIHVDALAYIGVQRITRLMEQNIPSANGNNQIAATASSIFLAIGNDEKSSNLFRVFNEENHSRSPLLLQFDCESPIVQLAAGKAHLLILVADGGIYSFGTGSRGELGLNRITNEPLPHVIESLDGIRIKLIAAGGWHSMALTDDGDVYVWGWNNHGQLGVSSKEHPTVDMPLPLDIDFNVVKITAGTRHSLLLSASGEVYRCGIDEKSFDSMRLTNDVDSLGTSTRPIARIADGIIDIATFGWSSVLYSRTDT